MRGSWNGRLADRWVGWPAPLVHPDQGIHEKGMEEACSDFPLVAPWCKVIAPCQNNESSAGCSDCTASTAVKQWLCSYTRFPTAQVPWSTKGMVWYMHWFTKTSKMLWMPYLTSKATRKEAELGSRQMLKDAGGAPTCINLSTPPPACLSNSGVYFLLCVYSKNLCTTTYERKTAEQRELSYVSYAQTHFWLNKNCVGHFTPNSSA